jgi:phycobilisome core component
MKEIVKAKVQEAGVADPSVVDYPFDYMTRELSEISI